MISIDVAWATWDTIATLTTWQAGTTTRPWAIAWTIGKADAALDAAYKPNTIPSSVIVDPTGKIAYSHDANIEWPPPSTSTLISEIDSLKVNQNPVASFVWSPVSPNVGDTVTFDASGSTDPDGTIISYTWNPPIGAGATFTYTYTTAGTYPVTLTVTDDKGGTDSITKNVIVSPPPAIHDIAVTDVTASPTTVIAGHAVSVEVDVENQGTAQETFNVDTYYDSSLIGTMSVTLSAGASTTLTFTWDTTGVSPGTYIVKAEVPPVTGETNTADNVFIDGRVTIEQAIVPVWVDIKPGSCPNPINVKSKGVFAVAIKGTKDFNVRTVDPSTVKIYIEGVAQGVSPIRWSYEDVTPMDGYLDIVFHFDTQTVVTKLGLTGHLGETLPLIIKGNLYPSAGALPIQGQDYIWILPKT